VNVAKSVTARAKPTCAPRWKIAKQREWSMAQQIISRERFEAQ
jgi:hypothetical protein